MSSVEKIQYGHVSPSKFTNDHDTTEYVKYCKRQKDALVTVLCKKLLLTVVNSTQECFNNILLL